MYAFTVCTCACLVSKVKTIHPSRASRRLLCTNPPCARKLRTRAQGGLARGTRRHHSAFLLANAKVPPSTPATEAPEKMPPGVTGCTAGVPVAGTCSLVQSVDWSKEVLSTLRCLQKLPTCGARPEVCGCAAGVRDSIVLAEQSQGKRAGRIHWGMAGGRALFQSRSTFRRLREKYGVVRWKILR